MLRHHRPRSTLSSVSASAMQRATTRAAGWPPGSSTNASHHRRQHLHTLSRSTSSSYSSSSVLLQHQQQRRMAAPALSSMHALRSMSTERRTEEEEALAAAAAAAIARRRTSATPLSSSSSSSIFLPEQPYPTHLVRGDQGRRPPSSVSVLLRPFSSQPAPKSTTTDDAKTTAATATGATTTTSSPLGASAGSTSTTGSGTTTSPPPRYVEEGIKPEDLRPEQGVEDPRKEENSPRTVGGIVRRYTLKAYDALRALPASIYSITVWAGNFVITFVVETVKNPASLREKWLHIKKVTVEELHHYKLGSKVLWSDIKTSWSIVRRLLNGHTLSRRERRQLTRTTADLFRLVPFAFFVIVPFMELLLPFALKIFPNMLPSTFQDNLKTEENMKRELKVRLALAGFLKDTLGEIANKKVKGKESPNAALLTEFVEKARQGTHISTVDINRFARLFKDELTLDNMSRPQLAGMCVYMGLRPYGSDNFLRFQLRAKLRNLKEDDQRIVWEGVDNMTKTELRDACRERGMRAYGLTQLGYRRQLQQWLDLSINKEVPISLLILSRAFTLDSKFADPAAAVADSISSLDKDVVNEVLLDVATGSELRNPDIRARKLESIERQNELIEEERKREEARRKKAEEEKKRTEEEKKAKEAAVAAKEKEAKATADSAAATTTTTVGAPSEAQTAAADTKVVKEAVQHAAKMTGTTPEDGMPHPKPKASEALPVEKILTEAEVVAKALPSLDAATSKATTSSVVEGVKKEEEAAAAAAVAARLEEEEEAAAEEAEQKKKKKKPELTVDEIKALRTLVKESSVEQEKTVLAKLKAELQAAATAKAAAAAKDEAVPKGPVESPPRAAAEAGEGTGAAGAPLAPLTIESLTGAAAPPTSAQATKDALAAAAAAPIAFLPVTPATATSTAASETSNSTPSTSMAPPSQSEAPSTAAAPAPAPARATEPSKEAVAAKEKEEKEKKETEKEKEKTSSMDKALEAMRMKVASMLDKLEVDIEKVETTIGDKLHMLDKDKDGVLTTAELSEVISHVLKRHTSEEEAQKIAKTMDKDADGILTVQELMDWIEHKSELLEELEENEENENTPSSPPPSPQSKKKAEAAVAAAGASTKEEGKKQ